MWKINRKIVSYFPCISQVWRELWEFYLKNQSLVRSLPSAPVNASCQSSSFSKNCNRDNPWRICHRTIGAAPSGPWCRPISIRPRGRARGVIGCDASSSGLWLVPDLRQRSAIGQALPPGVPSLTLSCSPLNSVELLNWIM